MSEKLDKIVEEIKGLTLLEAADLVKRLEEALGVTAAAAAPVVVAGAAGGRVPAAGAPWGRRDGQVCSGLLAGRAAR